MVKGANQAMLDAGELAANPADPDSAIGAYEEAMFTRTHPIAEMSAPRDSGQPARSPPAAPDFAFPRLANASMASLPLTSCRSRYSW
jgi:hypothetical protein